MPSKKGVEFREAPVTALRFQETDPECTFGQETGDGSFRMKLYSGKKVDHWLFGPVVVDLATLSHKKRIPVLLDHSSQQRAGWADRVQVADDLRIEGKLSKSTNTGKEVISLKDEGFPWEASAGYCPPGRVEFLGKDQKAMVNGREVTGPCEIWRDTELREASFCTFGADRETGLAAGDTRENVKIPSPVAIGKEQVMPEPEITMSADAVRETYPDAAKDIAAHATEQATTTAQDGERQRFAALEKEFPDHAGFVAAQFKAGSTIEQAKVAFADVLKAELTAEKEARKKDAEKFAEEKKGVGFKASDEDPHGDGKNKSEDPKNFMTALKAYKEEHKDMSAVDATRACAAEHPELYEKHRTGQG